MAQEDFRDQVREKLDVIYGNGSEEDIEDLCRVLQFLDDNDCKDEQGAALSPYWKSLKALLRNDRAFRRFAQRLVDDTKTAENNPKFLKAMHDLYDKSMIDSENPLPKDEGQGFDLVRLAHKARAPCYAGAARYLIMVPPATQARIMAFLPRIINSRSLLASADEVIGLVNKSGSVVMVGLAAVYFGYEAIKSIYDWYNGNISGKRCAKNVIDAALTTAAGVGGGIGGAALGSFAGPIGIFAGGVIGGAVAANFANFASDRLTQLLFGLPKEVAVENAYKYLGVACNASNADVNAAFRKLCLKHHPDKGGDKQDFIDLQSCMTVIKKSRGESL